MGEGYGEGVMATCFLAAKVHVRVSKLLQTNEDSVSDLRWKGAVHNRGCFEELKFPQHCARKSLLTAQGQIYCPFLFASPSNIH